jgi:hypothetical protein
LAARYDRIANWLATPNGELSCENEPWLQGGQLFSSWADRARRIGEGRR